MCTVDVVVTVDRDLLDSMYVPPDRHTTPSGSAQPACSASATAFYEYAMLHTYGEIQTTPVILHGARALQAGTGLLASPSLSLRQRTSATTQLQRYN